jgi:hypothetical protein
LAPDSASDPRNYAVKIWALKRSENYGSPHINEHSLDIRKATLDADRKTVFLEIPAIEPTRGMEIRCTLRSTDGAPFTRTIHNTIHQLGSMPGGR